MIEVNLNQIKRRLYADGCADLMRGMSWPALVASGGKSYEEAVQPWKRNVPELFTKRDRPTGQRTREHHTPRNRSFSHV